MLTPGLKYLLSCFIMQPPSPTRPSRSFDIAIFYSVLRVWQRYEFSNNPLTPPILLRKPEPPPPCNCRAGDLTNQRYASRVRNASDASTAVIARQILSCQEGVHLACRRLFYETNMPNTSKQCPLWPMIYLLHRISTAVITNAYWRGVMMFWYSTAATMT